MAEGLTFDPKTSALMLADFQNDIAGRGGKLAPEDADAMARFDGAIERAAVALAAARKAGLSVFHVMHEGLDADHANFSPHVRLGRFIAEQGALRPGDPGFDILPVLGPREGEDVVVKQRVSALAGTSLAETLRDRGIDTVLIGGVVTHWVVEGTVRHAADLGLRVIVLADACASGVAESHTGALDRMQFVAEISDAVAFVGALG